MNDEAMQDRDGSSSSDSEAEEVDLKSLDAAVKENPNNYEAHQKFIDGLRKSGDLIKLRAARENMNTVFPLSGKMWQDWTRDEARILAAYRPEEVHAIEALYERGVSEYLCVPLWVDYLEFVEERDVAVANCTAEGLEKMRGLYERAIVAAGLHMAEGWKIWEAYREFEEAVLLTLDGADTEVKEKQADRVSKLFRRQLGVPLINHASTLQSYKDWEAERGRTVETEESFATVLSSYERAAQVCEEYKAHEESVEDGKPLDAKLFQNFLLYISAEESKGDPARVQIIFERAISSFPAMPELWLKYTTYVEKLKVASVCKSVYRRALCNCPWTGELWKKYLLALERFSIAEEEVSAVFEQALQKSFQTPNEYLDIFLTRIDGLRRRMRPEYTELLRNSFERASTLLTTYFPDFVDRSLQLHAYWADVEARICNDLEAARGVWETLAKSSGCMTEVWQGYIAMELRLGNTNEARAIYKRCYSRKFEGNGTEVICYAWIRFEREQGSLEDYDKAVTKAGQRLEEVRSLQLAQDAKIAAKMDETETQPASKRKRDKDVKAQKKRRKTDEADVPKAQVPKPPQAPNPAQKPVHNDQLTVFVSNLGLEFGQEEVRKFFASCEGLKDVRLPKDKSTGKSRGLAYVEFENEDGVNAAILKNKTKLKGRKINVARSNPSAARQGAKQIKPLGYSSRATQVSKEGEPAKNNQEFRNMFFKKPE